MTIRMEERLWVDVRHMAKQAGMEISVPCAAIIRDFIRAGTHNMVREKRTSEHDFEEAVANLEKIVKAMIDAARLAIPPKGSLSGVSSVLAAASPAMPSVIREGAFVKAKTLCPLWPYC